MLFPEIFLFNINASAMRWAARPAELVALKVQNYCFHQPIIAARLIAFTHQSSHYNLHSPQQPWEQRAPPHKNSGQNQLSVLACSTEDRCRLCDSCTVFRFLIEESVDELFEETFFFCLFIHYSHAA